MQGKNRTERPNAETRVSFPPTAKEAAEQRAREIDRRKSNPAAYERAVDDRKETRGDE
jgi:hypothetical protein